MRSGVRAKLTRRDGVEGRLLIRLGDAGCIDGGCSHHCWVGAKLSVYLYIREVFCYTY